MTTVRYSGSESRPRRTMPADFHGDLRPRNVHLHDVEIRAGLRGQKCEIRRPLRIIEQFGQIGSLVDVSNGDRERWQFGQAFAPRRDNFTLTTAELIARSPYGCHGTHLHVVEWWANTATDADAPAMLYRADLPTQGERLAAHTQGIRWTNKIEHRPVPARLVYRIVDIWIDRLQPMEGLQLRNEGWLDCRIARPSARQIADSRAAFTNAWDEANLDEWYRWKENPWIWVMSVARVRS